MTTKILSVGSRVCSHLEKKSVNVCSNAQWLLNRE